MAAMNKHERDEFREFCQQVTDEQLLNIMADERERSEEGGVDREYYATCAGIAEAVASERGLEID